MVYSASTRSASISSITSQNQGGGNTKAGLVPKATSTAGLVAFNVRGLPQPMSFMMLPLSVTRSTGRGTGWRFSER